MQVYYNRLIFWFNYDGVSPWGSLVGEGDKASFEQFYVYVQNIAVVYIFNNDSELQIDHFQALQVQLHCQFPPV